MYNCIFFKRLRAMQLCILDASLPIEKKNTNILPKLYLEQYMCVYYSQRSLYSSTRQL